jgi:hypothetical protein
VVIVEVVDVDEVVDIALVSRRWLGDVALLGPLHGKQRDGWTRKRLSLFSCVLSSIKTSPFILERDHRLIKEI